MKTFAIFGSIMSLGVATLTAHAAEPRHTRYEPSAAVYVADLNLESVVDAHVLYQRIAYAAREVCTADTLSFDVRRHLHWRQCVEAATEAAVERADAPLLTSIHLRQRAQLAQL